MKPSLYVIPGGRVIERRRDPEGSPAFVAMVLMLAIFCLVVAIFAPWSL